MKHLLIALCMIFGLAACSQDHASEHNSPTVTEPMESLPLYQSAKAEVLDSLVLDICGSPSYEFEDLHAPRNTFDSGPVEHLKLSELLRSQGFEVTDWGSGNWPGGPHISSRTLENGTCSCQVDKLYYDPNENGLMRITERILCLPL